MPTTLYNNDFNNTWLITLFSSILFGCGLLLIIMLVSSIKSIELPFITYTSILLGLLLILTYVGSKMIPGKNTLSFIVTTGPFLLTAGTIMFLMYLLQKYKDIINDGHVSKQYYTFATSFNFLILLQTIFLFNGITSPTFRVNHMLPNIYNSLGYLIGILNIWIVITLFVILKYYSTDGFI